MRSAIQIRVKEQLDPTLSAWFDGFTVTHTVDGDTLLTGTVGDQAALYGLLARCRDFGLTLVSLNPVPSETEKPQDKKEQGMSGMHIEVSQIIDARPDEIWAIFSDYTVHHPAILPKPFFTGLTVERGGHGAGTLVMTTARAFGREVKYHQAVTEPEPGRVLLETEIHTGQWTTFTMDPVDGGKRTHVTLTSEFPSRGTLLDFLDHLIQPMLIRHVYRIELNNVADYVRSHAMQLQPKRA